MTTARYQRLRRSYVVRAKWFTDLVEHQRVVELSRDPGVADALSMLKEALGSSDDTVTELHVSAAGLPDDLTQDIESLLEAQLQLLRERITSHDIHFARRARELSPAIRFLLKERCAELDVLPKSLFVAVGEPGNFACTEPTFKEVAPVVAGTIEPHSHRILSITVPRIEGEHALWLPVSVGHELAHYLLRHRRPDELTEIENAIESDGSIAAVKLPTELTGESGDEVPQGASRATVGLRLNARRLANDWLHELMCDAYAVRMFGVAGYAALAEFLASVGSKDTAGDKHSHPPTYFRCRLMRSHITEHGTGLAEKDEAVLAGLSDLEVPGDEDETFGWANAILEFLGVNAQRLWDATAAWTGGQDYWASNSTGKVANLVRRIGAGIPPIEADYFSEHLEPATPPEIVNAAWLTLHDEKVKSEKWSKLSDAEFYAVVDRLASKAIDDSHFLASWAKAAPDEDDFERYVPDPNLDVRGVLATKALKSRLASENADRLVLTPLIGDPVGPSSIDIRLGGKFIVFDRAAHPAFDAMMQAHPDPRTMQHRVSRKWGEPFYLHPNQLVLASAMEYLAMPEDLSAQVVTRSSYGRLGMITATAVQVHPGYRGCLTLELINLGEIPIAIVPGQRIAQLMFFKTDGYQEEKDRKYDCPVAPEFSKVSQDKETQVLARLRELA